MTRPSFRSPPVRQFMRPIDGPAYRAQLIASGHLRPDAGTEWTPLTAQGEPVLPLGAPQWLHEVRAAQAMVRSF